jgi:hypothetical protein
MKNSTDITRRSFVQSVTAIVSSSAAVPAASALTRTIEQRLDYDLVIIDERFPLARNYARDFENRIRVLEIGGDITAAWYHELQPRWHAQSITEKPRIVAGVTSIRVAMILRLLAWQQHRRLIVQDNYPLHAGNAAADHIPLKWIIL